MSYYGITDYGRIRKDGSLIYSPDLVFWSDLLSRELIYKYDSNILDYDYLRSIPYIDELQQLRTIEYIVNNKYDGRPDQFCLDQYEDTDFWWIIMMINNFEDPDEFYTGRQVQIPNQNDIEEWLIDIEFRKKRDGDIL